MIYCPAVTHLTRLFLDIGKPGLNLIRLLKLIYWTSHLKIISYALKQEFNAVNQTPASEF